MNEEQRKIAEKILEMLSRDKFSSWYHFGAFDNYISGAYPEGDPKQPTKEQILEDIVKLFNI